MKTLLNEERIVIPYYDEIWNSVKDVIKQRMNVINPRMVNNYRRWQLRMSNIRGPKNAFFNVLNLTLDLYVTIDENQYAQIPDDFADSEVSPVMTLANNGKINVVTMRIKVATSQKNIGKDIGNEFYHELTHAYAYLERIKNGKRFFELQQHATYNVSSFRQILNGPASALEKNLAILLYFIDKDEYDARLNAFYNELKYNPPQSNNIKQIVTQTKEWRKIAFLYNVPFYMSKVTEVEDKEKLIAVANIMNEKTRKKYSDYQTLLKDIVAIYNKLKNDAYTDFSKIVQDIINNKKR